MDYITESRLTQESKKSIRKQGISYIADTLNDINGKNALIDYNFDYKDDKSYMDKLFNTCENISGYKQKIIYIPVSKWNREDPTSIEKSKTPLGCICRYMKANSLIFKNKFSGYLFIFYNDNGESLPLYVDQYKGTEYQNFINLITSLIVSSSAKPVAPKDIKSNPVKDIVDKNKEKKINTENKKKELVSAISSKVAAKKDTEEDTETEVEDDEYIKSIVAELDSDAVMYDDEEDEDDFDDSAALSLNGARTARIQKLDADFLNTNVNGETVRQIIAKNKTNQTLKPKKIKVSSINEEWDNVKFASFNESYDVNSDIMAMLESLSTKSYPISIVDIKVEDTSTNQDYVDTYTVQTEDAYGKRSTLVFDIPKLKNNRFMRLKGNEKVMSGQLFLLPCTKTDDDAVQCVSNYSKIFVYRYGMLGKSYPYSDKLGKALRKYMKLYGVTSGPVTGDQIRVYYGDNTTICSKYNLPTDYIDLASQFNRIETANTIYYFDQDAYRNETKFDSSKGIPYAISKIDGSISYYIYNNKDKDVQNSITPISLTIADELAHISKEFDVIFKSTKPADRLNYSQASIMSRRLPLITVIGYSVGLTQILNKLYSRNNSDNNYKFIAANKITLQKDEASIRFADGYLKYKITYASSMLLNGLSEFATETINFADMDKRATYLDFFDQFGGRIVADGLDNFADMFMDPITIEVCKSKNIPSNYIDMLMYANALLADNEYIKHTNINGNRYRTSEIIAGYFYNALSKAYAEYKANVKRGRKVGISMKRTAVIDAIMMDPMSSDLSIMNPLLEIEASNSVSFKGLSGMNSERSYTLDKRTYDDSMINKLALSTGFAANVGINRQTTIDMDIEGKRGYIKDSDVNDMGVTKTFGITEAITPFGTTRDDPFRSAMTFIQTSKHSMRTNKSMPLLITNGADEAMPYMSSDMFAFKAKEDGVVIKLVNDEYMIVKYNKPIQSDDMSSYQTECIDLRNEVKKNSDGGFFITLKLDTDLKENSSFKKGDIIAYDRESYSNKNGEDNNLAYNVGVLAKVAIMNTDEGFEDSTSVSSWLSDAMATDVVVEKEKELSKNTNVYNMVKVGQYIQEGEPLIIFQNSFDEKDANMLLKNITDPEYVSDLGRIKLKSKYTGVIQDIKIYRTCEIEDMSESLQKIVTEYEKKIKAQKAMYEKYSMPGANLLDPDYKMSATGIMKNCPDGVKIVFYIKYNDKLSVGDKTVAQSANKGVVKNIFPKGKEPFSEFRPEEKIHALYAARSFNARMVTSVWISGAINKCMIELDRKVKDIMGIPTIPIEEME